MQLKLWVTWDSKSACSATLCYTVIIKFQKVKIMPNLLIKKKQFNFWLVRGVSLAQEPLESEVTVLLQFYESDFIGVFGSS